MKNLQVQLEGSAAVLKLSGPRANALSREMVEELLEALDTLDPAVETLLITGEGRSFSSGFDLFGLDQETDETLLWRFVRIELLLQKLHHLPVQTFAIAHGSAYGAGADLFCACRTRIADPATKFMFPGSRFGIVLGTNRLVGRIGQTAAHQFISNASPIPADLAFEAGLVTELLPTDAWQSRLRELKSEGSLMSCKTRTLLFPRLDTEGDARDMASLIASAARPGLKADIEAYVARPRKA